MKSLKQYVGIAIVVISSVVIMSFQNCSMSEHTVDESALSRKFVLQDLADLSWTMSGSLKTNGENLVERWMDSDGLGIALFPPLRTNSTSLNMDRAPTFTSVQGGKSWLSFAPSTHLMPAVGDLGETVADSYTVLTVVRKVKLLPDPTGAYTVLRLFDLRPTNGDQTGQLGLDVYSHAKGLSFLAYFWFDGNNNKSKTFVVEDKTSGEGPFAIAVRYDKSGDDLQIFVNGNKGSEAIVKTGSPSELGYGSRHIYIHGGVDEYGSHSSFDQADFGVWRSPVPDGQLQSYTRAAYEVWSGTGSGQIGGGGGGDGGAQVPFSTISSLMDRCVGCHSSAGTRSGLMSLTSNSRAWVTPFNGDGSLMVQALRHQSGVRAMPDGGNAWPASDIDKIVQWINAGAR
ncbi:MAG: hypothetical protein AB7G93_19855 [Bdellovibrionales bacterium]